MHKVATFLSLSALLLPLAAQEQPLLRFTNGDSLPGALLRVEGTQLHWKSPALKSDARFFLNGIQDVSFPYHEPPASKQDHIAHIRFNPDLRQQNEKISGDVIQGELLAVNAESIILNTWYAGKLTLNRNMVKDLQIFDVSPPVYTGPIKADDWNILPEDSWTFENSGYRNTGSGSLTKKFKDLPERYCFTFHASWKNRFSMQILFGADDDTDQNPDNHYMIVLDAGTSYMQKRASDVNALGVMRNGGMIGEYKRDQIFQTKEKSQIKLYVDTKTGLFALYSDDSLIQQWTDVEKPILNGKAIHLRNTQATSRVVISRMSVSEWDGALPMIETDDKKNPIENPEPAKDEQRIILRNGDIMLGKVDKIENSQISLTTRYNEIKLPVSRIKKLALAPNEYDERLLQNGDVRAWFPDGNYITFRLESIAEDGKLTGYSQHFGTATFDPAAFTRIEFNIYPPPAKRN